MTKFNIKKIVKPSINKISKYIPGESINTKGSEYIKLSSNESPFSVPSKILTSLNQLISNSNIYPDGDSLKLKYSIAKRFNLKKTRLICGNGSDDILSIICQAFAREDCEVICSEYGFIYYPIIAKAAGCKVITAKTNNLGVSCENILNKITPKTKMIFIANPNNPTGTIIFKDELTSFLDNVPENIIVVLDGAYSEFITEKEYCDGIKLIDKYKNLIVTRTFSKIFALAGLRLGWGYSNIDIIELLEKIRGPFNVNAVAQFIGCKILEEKSFLNNAVKHNKKWQEILPERINEMGLETVKSYTNFVLIKVNPKRYSKKKILLFLKKNKILVRSLESYNLKNYFRVSIGSDNNMKKFLRILKMSINQ